MADLDCCPGNIQIDQTPNRVVNSLNRANHTAHSIGCSLWVDLILAGHSESALGCALAGKNRACSIVGDGDHRIRHCRALLIDYRTINDSSLLLC